MESRIKRTHLWSTNWRYINIYFIMLCYFLSLFNRNELLCVELILLSPRLFLPAIFFMCGFRLQFSYILPWVTLSSRGIHIEALSGCGDCCQKICKISKFSKQMQQSYRNRQVKRKTTKYLCSKFVLVAGASVQLVTLPATKIETAERQFDRLRARPPHKNFHTANQTAGAYKRMTTKRTDENSVDDKTIIKYT